MTQIVLPAFSAGILSEELSSSVELEKHRFGLKQCENMITDALGGAKNRPGTQYIDDAYDTTEKSRLIPFSFNAVQSYVLEFCDSGMRVIKDGGLVLRDLVDSAYKWTESVAQAGEFHLELAAGGDPGLMEPSKLLENSIYIDQAVIGSLTASSWNFGNNDTLGYNTVYVRLSDDADPDSEAQGFVQVAFLIASPYPIADVAALKHTQSADTLYLFHGSYKRRKVTRTGDAAWTITEIANTDGPYIGRVAGDEDVNIKVTFDGGTTWDIESATAIFDNVGTNEPIRLGFPVPGDDTALYWSWFNVSTKTDGSNIKADLQGGASRPSYQQVANPKFLNGLDSWEDLSDAGSFSSYDFTNQTAQLVDNAGDAIMEQAVLTLPNVKHIFYYTISAMTGASPTVTVKIGTATGLGDIYTSAALVAPAVVSTPVTPTTDVVYISFDSVGSTATDTISISLVELYAIEQDAASLRYHVTTDWRLAAFNDTYGQPENGIINEQRLMLARNAGQPQTIWPSELGNFESHAFNTPSRSTDAFSFNPPTPQINGISSMSLYNGLKIGTADAIWDVFAASGGVITPTDVNIRVDGAVGVLDLQPVLAGNSLIVAPRGVAAVTEITSSFETSGFVPRDVSILARHLFDNRRIVRWAYAKNPDSVIWCVLDNGELKGFSYIKEYDLWAWHEHTTPLGQGFDDVVVIPNSSDDNVDDVYFIVDRGTEQTPNYYIEQLNKRIVPREAAFGLTASPSDYDYRFLDSALTYEGNFAAIQTIPWGVHPLQHVIVNSTAHGFSNGDNVRIENVVGYTELNGNIYVVSDAAANTYKIKDSDGNYITLPAPSPPPPPVPVGGEARKMVTVITGLDHLEGQIVVALADGAVRGNLTVASGSITLPQAASYVHVGLAYTSIMETVDLEILADTGTTQGKLKGLSKADVYFKDSRQAEFTTANRSSWEAFKFENESFGEQPPDLYTGSKEIVFPSNYEKQETISIRQTVPLPLHVKRIIPDVSFGG